MNQDLVDLIHSQPVRSLRRLAGGLRMKAMINDIGELINDKWQMTQWGRGTGGHSGG